MTALHVAVVGVGPPILLLHGFTGDTSTMAVLADRLVATYRVISVDLIGHGRSPAPDDVADYSVDAMADDVASVIDEHATGSAHVVGYSMGGRVALTLACRHPDRVAALTLIGASPGIASAAERAARRGSDEGLVDLIEGEGLAAFVDRWMANPLFASQARLGPDFLAAARVQRLANDPAGLVRSIRGGGTGSMAPLHGELAGCDVPTTMIVGELDAKFRAIAAEMNEALPVSTIVTVPGAGHAAHLEQPDLVAAAIGEVTS